MSLTYNRSAAFTQGWQSQDTSVPIEGKHNYDLTLIFLSSSIRFWHSPRKISWRVTSASILCHKIKNTQKT